MTTEARTNKHGQTLGRKGLETRGKLMDATRKLLLTHSPVELTAVSITAEAGTSPASFYMYFDDTKDILFALSEVAGQDMAKIHAIFDEPWERANVVKHASDVINALNEVWNKHRAVLRYRNLEATRGDPRFEELRMNTFIPFIERFAQRILSINPAGGTRRRADAYAEASILHGALEHMAATDPEVVKRGLGAERINKNLARIVALVMKGEEVPEPAIAEPPPPASKASEGKHKATPASATPVSKAPSPTAKKVARAATLKKKAGAA